MNRKTHREPNPEMNCEAGRGLNRAPKVAQAGLRPPSEVMTLARMGASHPTRLSFIPALLRELRGGRWTFVRTKWEMDSRGVGVAVYRAKSPGGIYSLVAFGHDLPPERRSDRVIADAWDATFALCEGTPSDDDIARLRRNVPLQEAGRCGPRELVLSRANKSARAFGHVVESLRGGKSPDESLLRSVGYLMRTTAVYGNGKFGLADRDPEIRPQLRAPFRAEMLAVWMIRAFTFDWAEHLGGGKLSPGIKRALGAGNSTGLGMAPFLVNHPALLHQWVVARETALARVRAVPDSQNADGFFAAMNAAVDNAAKWKTSDARYSGRVAKLQDDLQLALDFAKGGGLKSEAPWDDLWRWGESRLTPEGQEALASAMIEPHGNIVDDLSDAMDADEDSHFNIPGETTIGEVRAQMKRVYDWVLADDFSRDESRFWYASEEKMEPRTGARETERGAEWELPLATSRDAFALWRGLRSRAEGETVGRFLARFPNHRGAMRRVFIAAKFPYAEIRGNLVGRETIPLDMLRCKLAFFGATRFDPKSDLWLRINMFSDSPLPCCFDSRPACGDAACPFRRDIFSGEK